MRCDWLCKWCGSGKIIRCDWFSNWCLSGKKMWCPVLESYSYIQNNLILVKNMNSA